MKFGRELVILVAILLEEISAGVDYAYVLPDYPNYTDYPDYTLNDDILEIPSRSTSSTIPSPTINFECGRRNRIPLFFKVGGSERSPRKVAGGRQSYANTWPWMILLGREIKGKNNYFCGAILINEKFALTAAHCVLDPNPFFARIGEHDHSKTGLEAGPARNVPVEDIIIHPMYKVNQGYFDVAILKLSESLTFTPEVRPVCLPWGEQLHRSLLNRHVTVTGWGAESFGGKNSPVLKEASLTVFPPSKCQKGYSTLRGFQKAYPKGFNAKNIVCAGAKEGGRDSCAGDSGGPIVSRNPDGSYALAGIVASGFGCGKKEFPGIYTPIRNKNILGWIKRIAF